MTDKKTRLVPATWFQAAGGVVFAIAVLATVMIWSEMSDAPYDTASRWVNVVLAVGVAGIGLLISAIGFLIEAVED